MRKIWTPEIRSAVKARMISVAILAGVGCIAFGGDVGALVGIAALFGGLAIS